MLASRLIKYPNMVTDKQAAHKLKQALSKSSIDEKAIEQAKNRLETIYGFNPNKIN